MIEIKLLGSERAKATVDRLRKESPKKLKRGMRKAGEFLLQESRKVTPIDTGFLRASGYVRVEDKPTRPVVEVGYTAPYAWIVHEDPNAFHPVGDWKYLERPARQYREHLIYIVTREFK